MEKPQPHPPLSSSVSDSEARSLNWKREAQSQRPPQRCLVLVNVSTVLYLQLTQARAVPPCEVALMLVCPLWHLLGPAWELLEG